MGKGIYCYYIDSPQDEIDFTDSVLDGENVFSSTELDKKEDLKKLTDKVLSLPIEQQLHFIHCVLNEMYSYGDDTILNDNLTKFLSQRAFSETREFMLTIVDNDIDEKERLKKLSKFENEFGIKMKDCSNEY